MKKTLAEIAEIVKGEVVGDRDLVVTGVRGLEDAQKGDLTFLSNTKYTPLCKTTLASAIITSRDIEIPGKAQILTDNPSLAFSDIIAAIAAERLTHFKGIHPKAHVGEHCRLGRDVAIGPCAVIEDGVTIGDGTVIYGGSYIGQNSVIGQNCLIHPNVTVREYITLKDRVIVHSGSVIGSDGFGYVQVGGRHKKIPQVGTVVVEDDVEIGANVTIDRARFDQTVIGKGTKIDNLVQVAHNVVMGENCIIISQVGISGTTKLGNGVILGGQVGTAGHIHIGDGAIVYSRAVATKNIPAKAHVSGSPARDHNFAKRIFACTQRLPKYFKIIEDLQKKVADLTNEIKGKKGV